MGTKVKKPICKLIGNDGNVFFIIGTVSRTLKQAGMPGAAQEFCRQAFKCETYEQVLALVQDYVEVE